MLQNPKILIPNNPRITFERTDFSGEGIEVVETIIVGVGRNNA